MSGRVLMRRRVALLLALLGALAAPAGAQAKRSPWRFVAPLPTARDSATAVQSGDVVYVIGGYARSGWTTTVEGYDLARKTWRSYPPLPRPRAGAGAAVLPDGRILVVGGFDGTQALRSALVYDPQKETWKPVAPLHVPRTAFGLVLLGGIVYAIGGYAGAGYTVHTVEAYDVATNQWSFRAPMPRGNEFVATNVVAGRIYAISGSWCLSICSAEDDRQIEIYDPASDTWSLVPAHTDTPPLGAGVALPDGRTLVAGAAWDPDHALVYSASPAYAGESPPMLSAQSDPAAVYASDGFVYVFGGHTASYAELDSVERIRASDITPPSAPQDLAAHSGRDRERVHLSWAASTDDHRVAGYTIYRAADYFEPEPIATVGPRTRFTDRDAPVGVRVEYGVQARDDLGNLSPISWIRAR